MASRGGTARGALRAVRGFPSVSAELGINPRASHMLYKLPLSYKLALEFSFSGINYRVQFLNRKCTHDHFLFLCVMIIFLPNFLA